MQRITLNDIIEVITAKEHFRAVVKHASNNGLAGMVYRSDDDPHILMSGELWDQAAKSKWLMDDGETVQVRKIE